MPFPVKLDASVWDRKAEGSVRRGGATVLFSPRLGAAQGLGPCAAGPLFGERKQGVLFGQKRWALLGGASSSASLPKLLDPRPK